MLAKAEYIGEVDPGGNGIRVVKREPVDGAAVHRLCFGVFPSSPPQYADHFSCAYPVQDRSQIGPIRQHHLQVDASEWARSENPNRATANCNNAYMGRRRFKKPKPLGNRVPSVDLPRPTEALEPFTQYLAAQFNRSTIFLRNDTFTRLIGAADAAYEIARTRGQNISAGRARILLTCHQSMYSAASSIARGVPLDAAAASRRALEGARTALAIKIDRKNAVRWTAFEERLSRWDARKEDEKPPKLKIEYEALNGDALAEKLATFIGILSDGAVHFTPEFLSRIDFQNRNHGAQVFSDYLEADDQKIAGDIKILGVVHLLILKTLDRVCDGGLSMSHEFPIAIQEIAAAAKEVYQRYPFRVRPEFDDELELDRSGAH
jgi:hypothetical protein